MTVLGHTWPMIAAVYVMLGFTQLFLWAHSGRKIVYLLLAITSFGAMAMTFQEMGIFTSFEPTKQESLLLWQNLSIALTLVSMGWAVQLYIPFARLSLAIAITVLWVIGLTTNFLLPGNLTFSEIHEAHIHVMPWGEQVAVPIGEVSDWNWLTIAAVFLIPVHALEAAWRSHHSPGAMNAWVIAVGASLFVTIAGLQAALTDFGFYHGPYLFSATFLIFVVAFTWVLTRDAVRAVALSKKVIEAQQETERLMRANLMGEVAAALAHEINQPLTAILGNAQAAEKFLDSPEPNLVELREILNDIVIDDKRARDVITNLRKMLAGDQPENQKVNPAQVVRDALHFLHKDLQNQSITVNVISEGDLPPVCGGDVAIQQVIMNLVVNAAKAISEANVPRREIRIRLEEKNGGTEIVVRDFGPGIAEEIMEKLFDPFVTTGKRNLGMGLTVCRRIIENQGGRIYAENPEGGGARFRVWLPVCSL